MRPLGQRHFPSPEPHSPQFTWLLRSSPNWHVLALDLLPAPPFRFLKAGIVLYRGLPLAQCTCLRNFTKINRKFQFGKKGQTDSKHDTFKEIRDHFPLFIEKGLSCMPLPHKCVHAQWLSCVQIFATPWTIVCQVLQSMGFSRQEYWRGLPFPTPGDLPDPGMEPMSFAPLALASRFLTTVPPGKPLPLRYRTGSKRLGQKPPACRTLFFRRNKL